MSLDWPSAAPTWIGTRTPHEGVFNSDGIGFGGGSAIGLALMTQGSLMLEVTTRPQAHPVNLLRYGTLDPWPSGVTLCLEPDGTLRLMMRQGSRHLATALKTKLGRKVQTVHITYIWDAPARKGHLSAYAPDQGMLWQTEVLAPFPLSLRDAERMMTEPTICALDRDVTFAAIADAPCPLGPQPSLRGDTAIQTPDGPRAIRDVSSGDLVTLQDGHSAQVLWAGQATLPALGRFAPMTLRQPYLGLWDDLVAARDQRACLSGSEVEYLFGEERVTTAIRHLEVRNCAAPLLPCPAVMTYHQILLDTHEIICANGAMVESFDGSAVLDNPSWLKTSVLADLAEHLRPKRVGLAAPVLQGYEALTLTGVSIG